MKYRIACLLPTAMLLASCQTWGPTWSEVTGQIYQFPREASTVAPTMVQNIDGNGAFPNRPGMPIKIEPGQRQLLLAAAQLSVWPGGTDLETMKLNAAPCVRYYIYGRYDNKLGVSWTPYIGHEESIAGCMVPGAGTASAVAEGDMTMPANAPATARVASK
jgi:hypothetical protein